MCIASHFPIYARSLFVYFTCKLRIVYSLCRRLLPIYPNTEVFFSIVNVVTLHLHTKFLHVFPIHRSMQVVRSAPKCHIVRIFEIKKILATRVRRMKKKIEKSKKMFAAIAKWCRVHFKSNFHSFPGIYAFCVVDGITQSSKLSRILLCVRNGKQEY